MGKLTVEQRNLLKQHSGEALRLVDPDTKQEYVLLQANVYDQLRALLTDIEPRELYPALYKAMADEG